MKHKVLVHLVMRNADGVIGAGTAEIDKWLALKIVDYKKMKKFKPMQVLRIQVDHPNGAYVWPA